MKNIDLKLAQVVFVLTILLALFGDCSAQAGKFNMMNGQKGDYSVELRGNGLLVNHDGHKWVERVEEVDTMNMSLTVWTSSGRWRLYYALNESAMPVKDVFWSAWCYGEGVDPIHYYSE